MEKVNGKFKILRYIAIAIFVIALVIMGICIIYSQSFENQLVQTKKFNLNRRQWQYPSKIYSDFIEYNVKDKIDRARLKKELLLHEYSYPLDKSKNSFAFYGDSILVYNSDFYYPDSFSSDGLITINLTRLDRIKSIKRNSNPEKSFRISPILIGKFIDQHLVLREYVNLDNISQNMQNAIIAAEDRHFFKHYGVNPMSMFRASRKNMKQGNIIQGGSTITQQLAKNLFLTNERTYSRKLKEVIASFYLETHLSKYQILEWYLNMIYLGYEFPYNICGIYEASNLYFSKLPSELEIHEAALIAALVPAPSYFNPFKYPERVKNRRDYILKAMLDENMISKEDFNSSVAKPLSIKKGEVITYNNRYFRELLTQYIDDIETFPSDSFVYFGNTTIYSTFEPYLYEVAESSITKGLVNIDTLRKGWMPDGDIQTALVSIDNRDRSVKVVIGGVSEFKDQFNRAIQAYRQPGSAFKMFVYLSAMDAPLSEDSLFITPSTLLPDTLSTFIVSDSLDSIWQPKNYGGEYYGILPVRKAIERSQNVATSYLTIMLTPERVIGYASKLGITSKLDSMPSIGLGAMEVTPYEMTVAAMNISNYCNVTDAFPLRYITNYYKETIYQPNKTPEPIMDSSSAFLGIDLLRNVVRFGRSYDVRKLGFMAPSCGKTGTSNREKDSWYVGFTKYYSTTVWIGQDDASPVGLTGTQAAIPIWTYYNIDAHKAYKTENFDTPSGIDSVWICHASGMLPTSKCSLQVKQYYLSGTKPTEGCNFHSFDSLSSLDSLNTLQN